MGDAKKRVRKAKCRDAIRPGGAIIALVSKPERQTYVDEEDAVGRVVDWVMLYGVNQMNLNDLYTSRRSYAYSE